MAELTTQEQADFDVLATKSFQYKFAQQLNQMSASLSGKISTIQEQVDDFKTLKGITIFKEDLKKEVDQDIWHQHLDDDGNQLVDDDGNDITITLDTPRRKSEAELIAFVDSEYDKELALMEGNLAHTKEEQRLIGVEQDFRARGIVSRDPIGTTYFQSFSGSDSNNGTTNATPYKYLNAFTETARSAGDIMVCRRPRGGINPSDLGYAVVVDGATFGGSSNQSGFSAVPNTHSGTTIKTPMYIAGYEKGRNQDASNTSYSNDNGFLPNYLDRCADPRDRSQQGYWYNRYFSISESYSERITFTSDGSGEDPIMVVADYENEWGDFIECANGKNGDDHLNGGDDSTNNARGGGYIVEFGSKIIRRTHDGSTAGAGKEKIPVHSYITPGDCIFVGSLTGSNNKPNVAPNVGDDPYEHSYIVRDVNYDKIVLWTPYKGEMAGEKRTIVSMGYQPRWRSIGYGGHDDDIQHYANDTYCIDTNNARNWLFQGITWTNAMYEHTSGDHPERRKLMHFYGDNSISFKDCQFIGGKRHNDSYPYYNRCDALWYITGNDNSLTAERCLFLNAKMGIYEYYSANTSDYSRGNTFKIRDCVFNGWNWSRVNGAKCETHWDSNENGVNNQYDSHAFNLPMGGIVNEHSASQWDILDCEFVNHSTAHIWMNSPSTSVKMRNLQFLGAGMDFVDPTATTIYEAHENLGLRWARPAFAGGVTAYSDAGANSTNGGDPTVGMNDVTNNSVSSIIGTQVCRKVDPDSGLWTSGNDNYGRKFYTYLSHNIPNGSGGYTDVNETSYDANNYVRTDYKGAENITGGTVTTRSAYRRIGGVNYSQRSNWYTGYERGDDFNRFDNSTHRYDYTCHFGATALYGATDINPATGQMKFETGLEKWNYWWCTDVTSNTVTIYDESKDRTYDTDGGSNKVPKGQPFADEIFAEYDWWVSHPTNGNWWYSNDYGQHNQFNNDRNQYRANFYRFQDSYRYRTMPAWNNLSVNDTDDLDGWGTSSQEQGNGPGQGIGASPWFGPVMTRFPNYYINTNTVDLPRAGHNDMNHQTIAVQDYYHRYLNYDIDLNRSAELYPEVFHPMIKGSRKGESTGISKNIVFQHGNKVHSWTTQSAKPYFTKGYGQLQPPMMETVGQAMDNSNALATILRSGGGSYVIKVFPTTYGYGTISTPDGLNDLAVADAKHYGKWYDDTGLKIFEYPFYLSTNARTYTVYLNRGLRTGSTFGWASDPTHYEVFLEMEYFASKPNSAQATDVTKRFQEHGVRRKDRSSSGLDFQSGTGGWEALALTVTPETEGVGYLRLWWKKPKESNRANIFYVDPKVEVT